MEFQELCTTPQTVVWEVEAARESPRWQRKGSVRQKTGTAAETPRPCGFGHEAKNAAESAAQSFLMSCVVVEMPLASTVHTSMKSPVWMSRSSAGLSACWQTSTAWLFVISCCCSLNQ